MMTREEWDALLYPIEVRKLSTEEGDGFIATIPMLGAASFVADGETAEEAIQAVEAFRRGMYEEVVGSGQLVPLPNVKEDQPNGKILLRISSFLHSDLKRSADDAGVSLNHYVAECVSRGHMMQAAQQAMHHLADSIASQTVKPLEGVTQRLAGQVGILSSCTAVVSASTRGTVVQITETPRYKPTVLPSGRTSTPVH